MSEPLFRSLPHTKYLVLLFVLRLIASGQRGGWVCRNTASFDRRWKALWLLLASYVRQEVRRVRELLASVLHACLAPELADGLEAAAFDEHRVAGREARHVLVPVGIIGDGRAVLQERCFDGLTLPALATRKVVGVLQLLKWVPTVQHLR